MGKCKVFTLSLCRQIDGRTDGQTDGRTTVKQYAPPPDLLIRGHKNTLSKYSVVLRLSSVT